MSRITDDPMRATFFAAAAFNLVGIGITTQLFTDNPLAALWPGLFGTPGCVLIAIWGLAYASVADRWRQVPALCGVFAIEKLFYGASWVLYWAAPTTPTLAWHLAEAPSAAGFYLCYGAGDLLFAGVFALAAWTGRVS